MVEFNKSCLVNITIISVIQYVVLVYEHFTDSVSVPQAAFKFTNILLYAVMYVQ
jgi:hypothetical protein